MFLLDADVMMTASRSYYGFDIAPGFWHWLQDVRLTGQVASIQPVKDEITRGGDQLVAWARQLRPDFWLADDAASVASFATLSEWTDDAARPYTNAARSTFLASADIRLIAMAHAHRHTVVTIEASAPDSRRAVKIPDACRAFNVPVSQPFDTFRSLGLRLH